jgi:UDP-3-O-[3-hydroxymyristoyl] glucosamine N-acyltransferase
MKLSEINIESVDVVRDGVFEFIGNITQNKSNQLSFIENEKYLTFLSLNSNISCILTTYKLAPLVPEGIGIIVSSNPKISFYLIHNYLAQNTDFYGKSSKTTIRESARIHPSAYVAREGVYIGENCSIGPKAIILKNTILEENVIVRAGSVIGTEGFRFERVGNEILPIYHMGGVLLHKRVEIQANSCVASAKFGGDFTEIGEDTKIDNLVHIAHNVKIGKRCLIAASAVVAGSTTIGDDVWIGPNACISNKLTVGDKAFITMGSVVTQNVDAGKKVTGNFAIDHNKFIESIKRIR